MSFNLLGIAALCLIFIAIVGVNLLIVFVVSLKKNNDHLRRLLRGDIADALRRLNDLNCRVDELAEEVKLLRACITDDASTADWWKHGKRPEWEQDE